MYSSLHGVSSSPLVLASPNAVIDPGGGEVLDPWRSPVSRQTTATLALPQRGLDVFGWGNEEQSESVSLVTQLPPQPFSPVKTDPQDDDKFHLSTIPSPSADLTQRSASTLPRSLGQRQHVSAPSRLSPPRHPRPPITAWTTLSPRSQSPSILQRSNQRLSQMYSKEDQHQAHPLSQDSLAVPSSRSLAVPSSRHCDVRVSRMASSIQPIPGWLSGEGCLDQRLAAITPRDSKLTQSRTSLPNDTPLLTRSFPCRIPLCGFQNQTGQMVSRRDIMYPARAPEDPSTGVGDRTQTYIDKVKEMVLCFPGHAHRDIL